MKHSFKLLAFDFDGTLMDSQRDIVFCAKQAFAKFGFSEPHEADVRQQVGLNLPDIMANLLPEQSNEVHLALADAYRDVYLAKRLDGELEERLYEGVNDVLLGLQHDELFMAICTGKKLRGLVPALDHNQIAHYFHSLHTPDNAPGKPNPIMLQQAMDYSATPAEQTLMIGDTSYDMEMACNAGVRAIGVNWGYHSRQHVVGKWCGNRY